MISYVITRLAIIIAVFDEWQIYKDMPLQVEHCNISYI